MLPFRTRSPSIRIHIEVDDHTPRRVHSRQGRIPEANGYCPSWNDTRPTGFPNHHRYVTTEAQFPPLSLETLQAVVGHLEQTVPIGNR